MPVLPAGGGEFQGLPYGPGINEIYGFLNQKGYDETDLGELYLAGVDLSQLATTLGYGGVAGGALNLFEGDDADALKAMQKMFAGLGGGAQGPTVESLLGQLRQSGFMLPFDVMPLVKSVAGKPYALDTLMNKIANDPRFRKAYPGLMDDNGNFKMSPRDYMERRKKYRALASQYGFGLSDAQYGSMIQGDVSENEADFRFKAAQTVYRNQDVFLAFKAELDYVNAVKRSKGEPPLPSFSNIKDVMNFVTKTAPKELYGVYEAAALKSAAKGAGVSLSEARARELAAQTAGVFGLDEAEKSFREIAEALRSSGAELSAFGISQRDLETIEFGGAGREEKAARARTAIAQREAQARTEITGPTVKIAEAGEAATA